MINPQNKSFATLPVDDDDDGGLVVDYFSR